MTAEPNDFRGEDAVFMQVDGLWNDLKSGLSADEPIEATLQPDTSSDESTRARFPYVIEYPTRRQAPFDGIDSAPVPPPLMPAVLPGVDGGAGFIGVTDFFTGQMIDGPISSVSQTLIEIENGKATAQVFPGDQSFTRTDLTDLRSNGSGGPILDGPPFNFPGGGGDNFISVGKGWIDIPESGTYTIQVHSDDGFALQLPGRPFTASTGGQREGDILFYPGNTDDTNAFGVVDLPAGPQELKFFMWEHNAGAYWEISTAQGDRPKQARYLAIGDSSVLNAVVEAAPVRLTTNVTIANVTESNGGAANDLETARDNVLEALDMGTALVRNDVDLLVIKDQDAICCARPGDTLIEDAIVWPLNDPETGGVTSDVNHFSSMVFGKLTIDDGDNVEGETLPITIGMFSSDGAQFHISGVDFIAGNDNADLSYTVDGDVVLTFPELTGNSDTFGLLELTEGIEYDFDGVHFENEGDSGYEIWAAKGVHLDGFDPVAFFPLSRDVANTVIPGNRGWALIAAPSLERGDYNSDGMLDSTDLDLQAQAIIDQDLALDENNDGVVDFADRAIWVNDLKGTWLGDADLNGQFNGSDLVIVFRAGKYETDEQAGWKTGDWDGDQDFDSNDLVIAFANGGYEVGQRNGNPSQATPEPAGIVMGLLGLLGLMHVLRP